jgi:hypothetical protein
MAPARPLRDVFADLVGDPSAADDPAALLRDQGHPGLPDHLVAEAVVSYADTAPVEVAEHLAPYVTAHSAVGADAAPGDEPPASWLDLLGTAPDVAGPADIDDLAPEPGESGDAASLHAGPDLDLDFGTGAGPVPVVETDADDAGPDDAGPDAHGGDVDDELGEGSAADPADPHDGDAAGWMDAGQTGDDPSDGPSDGPSDADEPDSDGEPLG